MLRGWLTEDCWRAGPLLPFVQFAREDAMKGWQLSAAMMACFLAGAGPVLAAELRTEIKQATPTGTGDALGTVTISDSAGGAASKAAPKGRPPGPPGCPIPENGSRHPASVHRRTVPAP